MLGFFATIEELKIPILDMHGRFPQCFKTTLQQILMEMLTEKLKALVKPDKTKETLSGNRIEFIASEINSSGFQRDGCKS